MGKGTRNRLNRTAAKQGASERDMKRVVMREINQELSRATDRFFRDETAVILWVLHETFGFGKDRLKKFYVNYEKVNNNLKEHYAMSDSDMKYLADRMLKDIGVDLDEWSEKLVN